MRSFNPFIIALLIFLAAGFLFFRDGFLRLTGSQSLPSADIEALTANQSYLNYSKPNLLIAQKKGKPLLFFAATVWCQTCSQLDKEIKQRYQELPSDVTILKVDYDNDKETKAEYQVIAQHTLIQLDSNGNEIKRWIGGNLDALVQNIQ